MKTVLVTGGYGYIGSHTIKALAEAGYTVDSMDYKQTSNIIKKYVRNDRIRDTSYSPTLESNWGDYDAVVHLAAYISVEQSVKFPWLYFKNNIIGTQNVIEHVNTDHFIFASTAAVFDPVSPYAVSKLACEHLIKNQFKNYTIFRFFNVAGDDGEFKQNGPATHLVRIAAEVAAGKKPFITINGTDWETEDGTCVRDYIHVIDLANSIVKAIEKPSNKEFDCIGSNYGYSVKQVIDVMKYVSNCDFEVREGPRRLGDAAKLIIPEGMVSEYVENTKTIDEICLSSYITELKT
jgi:UDP-glucose 4-epimerase